MTANPLQKLFRHKSLYTSLPSKGRFYSSGINLSVDNEIGIMPMTAADEIKLKTPDSLFNGEALFELFRSCVPDIINPEEIPVCDIDKLLLGIRVATQGKTMDSINKCPKCKKEETYVIDIIKIMNTAQELSISTLIKINDELEVEVKPLTLRHQIKNQVETFYHYRMQQMILDNSTEIEKKSAIFDEALINAIVIQISQMAESIVQVSLGNENDPIMVTAPDHIYEWVKNMDSQTHSLIKARLTELNKSHINDNVKIQCSNPECNHEYSIRVDLNPVNFFWPR